MLLPATACRPCLLRRKTWTCWRHVCDATACYCLQALSLVSKDMDLLEACMPTLIGTSSKAGLLQLLPYHYNVYNAQIVHHLCPTSWHATVKISVGGMSRSCTTVQARYCEKNGGWGAQIVHHCVSHVLARYCEEIWWVGLVGTGIAG